jgi:hypothetical protein
VDQRGVGRPERALLRRQQAQAGPFELVRVRRGAGVVVDQPAEFAARGSAVRRGPLGARQGTQVPAFLRGRTRCLRPDAHPESDCGTGRAATAATKDP